VRSGDGAGTASGGDGTSRLQRGVEEEVGIVLEGDILAIRGRLAFEDLQLDDGRRVDGAAVGRG
jgi:hypothetical protein